MVKQIEKTVIINASPPIVWKNLTNANLMKQWMGEPELKIEIITDWKVGNSIIIKAFHHVQFENSGIILQFDPNHILQYSHFSSISRLPDKIENYSIITFVLTPHDEYTLLTVRVENFPTETIYKHLNFYWQGTILLIKQFIERQ